MKQISNKYKQSVYAPSRHIQGRITFDISDPTAKQDIVQFNINSDFILSNKNQVINLVRGQTQNFLTWEKDRVTLDGSFKVVDDDLESLDGEEIGFVSEQISDENGLFASEPTFIFEFSEVHSSRGLTITFDVLNNEYAEDFLIKAFDSNNNLIVAEQIINNTEAQVVTNGQFYMYKKIEVYIQKWCKTYGRCRVAEIDFGIIKIYDKRMLMDFSIIEEMDITSSILPYSELKFTVYNKDKEFNILNPAGFYKFLQQRQHLLVELGLEVGNKIEYVDVGEFFLYDWISDENSLTATFTARNILNIMDEIEYENLIAKQNYTLYELAEEIFDLCGIEFYSIDQSLQNIETFGLVKKTTCKNVLQLIAIAGRCNIIITERRKVNIIKSYSSLNNPKDIISLANSKVEPKIQLLPTIKSVEVFYYQDIENKLSKIAIEEEVLNGINLKVDNSLINFEVLAEDVASWILEQSKLRAKYTSRWRGNPTHELNDIVIVEDSYQQNMPAIITRQELKYKGYLEAKTELRGKINA